MKKYICMFVLFCSVWSMTFAQGYGKKITGTWTNNHKNYNVQVEYSGNPTKININRITIDHKSLSSYFEEIRNLEKDKQRLNTQLSQCRSQNGTDDDFSQDLINLNRKVDSLQNLIAYKDNQYVNSINEYQEQENSLNHQIDSLRRQLNTTDSKSNNGKELRTIIKDKENEIKRLTDEAEKAAKNCAKQLEKIEKEKQQLQASIDAMASAAGGEVQTCQTQLNQTRKQLEVVQEQYTSMNKMVQAITKELQLHPHANQDTLQLILEEIQTLQQSTPTLWQKPQNRDYFSCEAGFGRSFIYSSQRSLSNGVSNKPSWSVRTTYSHYFNSHIPLALTVGISFGKHSYDNMMNDTTIIETRYQDVDNDYCDVHCAYTDVHENMSLTYIDIPICLTYGNTFQESGIQGWVKLGVTFSINVGRDFSGSKGFFSTKGHYSTLSNQPVDVWIEDVPSLGYQSNQPLFPNNSEPYTMSTFVLLGTAEAGVYIPMSSKIGFTLGAYLTHSLFPSLMKSNKNEYMPNLSHHFIFEEQNVKMMSCGVRIGFNISL